jgi:hypothetical protein
MASMPPPASDLHMHSFASLRAADPPQPSLGDPQCLRPPSNHGGDSLCVSEGIMNLKTLLAGVAVGTLREDAKACPQHP